ncbi:MAG: ATP-binding protein [Halorhabdus sp.]
MGGTILYARRADGEGAVREALRNAGFSLTVATDTDAARDALESNEIDCVVSRYAVPRPNGLEFGGGLAVLETVRDVDPECPCILFTPVVNADIVEDAIARGIDDYVHAGRDGATGRLVERATAAIDGYQARKQVESLSRVNELIRDVNSDLVRADDTATVAEHVCSNLTRLDTYGLAWLRLGRNDDCVYQAVAGDDAATFETSVPTFEHVVADPTAVLTGQAVPESLRAAGYASVMIIRLRHEGHRRGTLGLCADRTTAFDGRERTVLAELGATIGYALAAIETREQLKARERELTERNERLEKFASMVSHDLRNPLQVARGHAELLEGGDHAETIVTALDRIESIVENIVTLTRDGSIDLDLDIVDLGEIARSVWADLDVERAALVVDSPPEIKTDRTALRQILENLFRNSLEHGRPTTASAITIRIGPTDDGNGFVVADDGQGIPDDRRNDIFERGLSDQPSGTGFGLAIVRALAQEHGWTVAARESETGGVAVVFTDVETS